MALTNYFNAQSVFTIWYMVSTKSAEIAPKPSTLLSSFVAFF